MGVHEPFFNITVPLVLLAFGSLFVGYFGKEIFLSNVMSPIVTNSVKTVPLLFSLFGGVLAFVVYNFYMVYTAWLEGRRGFLRGNRYLYIGHSVYTFFNSA